MVVKYLPESKYLWKQEQKTETNRNRNRKQMEMSLLCIANEAKTETLNSSGSVLHVLRQTVEV